MDRSLLIVGVLVVFGITQINHNSRLTTANIVSVRPGMTMGQVRSILGEPLSKDSMGPGNIFCPCNPEHTCHDPWHYTWTYTAHRIIPHPMLWVHFNSHKKVREVYAKEYFGPDDRGIYSARQDPCDTNDHIVPVDRNLLFHLADMQRHFGP